MQFNLLGPLEVLQDGCSIQVTGLNQRAILAYLLLHPNNAVAVSELVSAVWSDEAPPTARKMLQTSIARLRELLALADSPDQPSLVTRPPGYALLIDPQLIDLQVFHQLTSMGRAALADRRWEDAVLPLRSACQLWRGPFLADLVESGISWPELTVIGSARVAAFEDRMDAELAVGHHHEVLLELEAAVSRSRCGNDCVASSCWPDTARAGRLRR